MPVITHFNLLSDETKIQAFDTYIKDPDLNQHHMITQSSPEDLQQLITELNAHCEAIAARNRILQMGLIIFTAQSYADVERFIDGLKPHAAGLPIVLILNNFDTDLRKLAENDIIVFKSSGDALPAIWGWIHPRIDAEIKQGTGIRIGVTQLLIDTYLENKAVYINAIKIGEQQRNIKSARSAVIPGSLFYLGDETISQPNSTSNRPFP